MVLLRPGKGGTATSIKCEIRDIGGLHKKLDKMKEAPEKVLRNLTADAKKRVPGWVAAEVVKQYGVKKGEITGQKVGTVTVKGRNIKNTKIIYRGRTLTPTHFSMSPKAPKPNRGAYTLKATIIKGNRATLGKVRKMTKKQRAALAKNFHNEGTQNSDHSPVMLMPAAKGSTTYIPFQRKSQSRSDVEAVKTLSLPQMVSSKRTEDGIYRAINDGLGKRLDHHMERYLGK